jgi:hypothetical protein
MFIRVRRRALKGGHPEWRAYRKRHGCLVTASASYDVVHAVRINGKPRHQFVFGLGSLKQPPLRFDLLRFWICALARMCDHGLSLTQCQRLTAELIRKGAPEPTANLYEEYAARRSPFGEVVTVRKLLTSDPTLDLDAMREERRRATDVWHQMGRDMLVRGGR